MYIPQGVVHCFFFGGDFLPLSAERGGLFVDALGFLCLRSWFLESVTLPPSVPQRPSLAFPSIPPPPPLSAKPSKSIKTQHCERDRCECAI